MKPEQKRELAHFFEAPKPLKKRAFLRNFGRKKLSIPYMLRIQLTYISRWVWVLSAAFFIAVWIGSSMASKDMLWLVCVLIPFVVTASVTESFRSVSYGMAELEMTARFSLKSVLLARMGILGIGNLILLLALTAVIQKGGLDNMIYILIPYLLTAFGGLWTVRKFPGKEGNYACLGVGASVSVLECFLFLQWEWIFSVNYLEWQILAVAGLLILTVRESRRTIRNTEDFAWN